MFSIRCLATVRSRTTVITAPVLLAACELWALPSNGSVLHNMMVHITDILTPFIRVLGIYIYAFNIDVYPGKHIAYSYPPLQ